VGDTKFTVGDLKRELSGLDDNAELSFAGGLHFFRLKRWGDDEWVVEFNEPIADWDREAHPGIQVAFCRLLSEEILRLTDQAKPNE
jgi:hypothetical protein